MDVSELEANKGTEQKRNQLEVSTYRVLTCTYLYIVMWRNSRCTEAMLEEKLNLC